MALLGKYLSLIYLLDNVAHAIKSIISDSSFTMMNLKLSFRPLKIDI